MMPGSTTRCRALIAAAALLIFGSWDAIAQDAVPAEFQGIWVPATANCESPVRFRVSESQMELINGQDTKISGDIVLAHSFFGPDYDGISVVAIPEFNSDAYPFTVFFNADERKGVTRLDIYTEMKGPMNAQVRTIQEAARQLSERFPLHGLPLKRCGAP